jgi:hypothetical protein
MDIRNHPEYAPIENHIRDARVERVVILADGIARFIVDCWNALLLPPAPPAILPIDRRRESRSDVARAMPELAHR